MKMDSSTRLRELCENLSSTTGRGKYSPSYCRYGPHDSGYAIPPTWWQCDRATSLSIPSTVAGAGRHHSFMVETHRGESRDRHHRLISAFGCLDASSDHLHHREDVIRDLISWYYFIIFALLAYICPQSCSRALESPECELWISSFHQEPNTMENKRRRCNIRRDANTLSSYVILSTVTKDQVERCKSWLVVDIWHWL